MRRDQSKNFFDFDLEIFEQAVLQFFFYQSQVELQLHITITCFVRLLQLRNTVQY